MLGLIAGIMALIIASVMIKKFYVWYSKRIIKQLNEQLRKGGE